jgi:hypothetical protein
MKWWLKRLFRRDRVIVKIEPDIRTFVSPGRSTTRRPGETWAQATNRLTEGNDLA